MSDVTLTIDGRRYGGWTQVSVTRSIETIAGAFTLALTEREPANPELRAFAPGQRCTVEVDGEVVITGWVDAVEIEHAKDSHVIAVRGRDATGDLVDCSADNKPGQWSGLKLDRIVTEICAPFGIKVTAAVDVGRPFPEFAINQDGAFDAIERACRQRAVLPVSDGKGGLLLTRAGTELAPTALIYGQNILRARGSADDGERFSEYIVRGQDDPQNTWTAGAVTQAQGRASDPGIKRHRPRIIIAEAKGDGANFQERAKWEASMRAGRARRATFTVQGWRGRAGELWQINRLVTVRDPLLGMDGQFLASTVAFTKSGQGTLTEISVARREAFELIELPDKDDVGLAWNG